MKLLACLSYDLRSAKPFIAIQCIFAVSMATIVQSGSWAQAAAVFNEPWSFFNLGDNLLLTMAGTLPTEDRFTEKEIFPAGWLLTCLCPAAISTCWASTTAPKYNYTPMIQAKRAVWTLSKLIILIGANILYWTLFLTTIGSLTFFTSKNMSLEAESALSIINIPSTYTLRSNLCSMRPYVIMMLSSFPALSASVSFLAIIVPAHLALFTWLFSLIPPSFIQCDLFPGAWLMALRGDSVLETGVSMVPTFVASLIALILLAILVIFVFQRKDLL